MSASPSDTATSPGSSRLRTARIANATVFGLHAALFAAWIPHIPSIKDKIGLHEGTLGITLLGAPVGALIAVILVGPALARWGSRRCMRVTMVGYAVVSPTLGLADSMLTLFIALAAWGAFLGALDVAMNAQAVTIEARYERPIMSSFHATWSACAAIGAGIGTLALLIGLSLAAQLAILGGLFLLLTAPLTRTFFPDRHVAAHGAGESSLAADSEQSGGRFAWVSPRLLVIAGIMFAALLCEGAAADWAPLYLRDTTHAPEVVAGLGYTLFATMMFVGRAFGDRWVKRFGAGRVVGGLSLVGAIGLSVGLLVAEPLVSLAAFAVYGLGIACIVPVCLSAAAAAASRSGAHVGPALALADGAGRTGFLLGPPLIGNLAYVTSLPVALSLLPILCVGVTFAARALNPPPLPSPTSPAP
jgi:MFS family permease